MAAVTGNDGAATEHTEEPQLAELLSQEAGLTAEIELQVFHSIRQIEEYYIQIAIKLMHLFLAMLQSSLEIVQEVALTWLTPLELAACFHLASACIHQDVHTYRCEPNHCWVRASTGPSVHEMSAAAVALATLLLALMDWHVPRVTQWQPITCRVLT